MPEGSKPSPKAAPSAADAEVAVARLTAISADLRGCVILDAEGSPLAASGPIDRWAEAGRELLAAADAAAGLMLFDIRAVLRDLARGPDAIPARTRAEAA